MVEKKRKKILDFSTEYSMMYETIKEKKMKVRSIDVGRTVMVRFNEGRMEGILVEVDTQNKSAKVFFSLDNSLNTRVEFDQITEIGQRVDLCPV